MKEVWRIVRSRGVRLLDVRSFLEGTLRVWLYYRFRWLLPRHIVEQFEWRLRVMDRECYEGGSCKECGCMVPGLQMSDRACDGGCYPAMMGRREWEDYKKENGIDV